MCWTSEGPVVWASGRWKQRPLSWNTRPQHGWLTSKFPSMLRHRRDRERPNVKKKKKPKWYLLTFIFPQRGHPSIKHQNKKHPWRHRLKKQPLILISEHLLRKKGQRDSWLHTQLRLNTSIVLRYSAAEDSLNIQLSEMFASPPSLLWQTFMIILSWSSGVDVPFQDDETHIWITESEVDFALNSGAPFREKPQSKSWWRSRDLGGGRRQESGLFCFKPRVTSGDDYIADLETDLTLPRSF